MGVRRVLKFIVSQYATHMLAAVFLIASVVIAAGDVGPHQFGQLDAPPRSFTAAADASSVSVCFSYPNSPQDLGFDYIQNYARLKAYQQLSRDFPNTTIRFSTLYSILALTNATAALSNFIATANCTLMICATNQILALVNTTSFLATYSNVRFVEYNNVRYFSEAPQPNFKAIGISVYAAWYAAGAAAGVQCEVCVGFIHPLSSTITAVNAFYRGMKFGAAQYRADQRQCPIFSVSLGAFYDPPNEMLLADLFVRKGCDVIAYWADSQAISQYVRELRNASIFSVSNNVDASKFWGDSVLTSNFFDMSVVYYQYVQELMENKPLVRKYMTQSNGSDVADISPRAKRNASIAATAAFAQQVANYTVWCGGFISDAGRVITPPSQCRTDQSLPSSITVEMGVVAYPRLVKPTNCGPGTFASYNTSVNFSLTCLACPAGTYSAVNGSISCSPCAALLEPNSNQSGCVLQVVSDKSDNWAIVIYAGIIVPIVCVLIISVVVWVFWRKRQSANIRQNLTAPRGPIVGFIALSVDPTRSVPSWRQDLGFACSVFEELAEVVLRSCRVYGGYIIFSAGDSFMIAGPGAEATFELARSIEKHFAEQPTSAKVSLRIVVTAGEPIIVEKRKRAVNHNTLPEDSSVHPNDQLAADPSPVTPHATTIIYRGSILEELKVVFASWPAHAESTIAVHSGLLRASPEIISDAQKETNGALRSTTALWPLSNGHEASMHWIKMSHNTAMQDFEVMPPTHLTSISPTLTPSQRGLAAPDSGHTATVEGMILFDCSILTDQEMWTLLRIATKLSRLFLSLLDVGHRKVLVRSATAKLHVRLDVNLAKRTDTSNKKVVFGEEQVIRQIFVQVLKTMDEQELLLWLRSAAEGCKLQ